MRLIAAISKLPQDLQDVRHILPEWLQYLYLIAWWMGLFLIMSLAANLIFKWLNIRRESLVLQRPKETRRLTKYEFKSYLAAILSEVNNTGNVRIGLHQVSALVKAYFEINLKKDIEEMTATEIAREVKERKDLGTYFQELSQAQYKMNPPENSEFVEIYNKTVELTNKS